MTDFRIGMKLSEVLKNLERAPQAAKTGDLIFNFCKNDRDGVITNANELAMLNAWFAGTEKVKMPNPQDEEFQKAYPSKVKEYDVGTVYGNDAGETMRVLKNAGIDDNTFDVSLHIKDGVADFLYDKDKDGYADERAIHTKYGIKYAELGIPGEIYKDDKLNGELKKEEGFGAE